MRGNSFRKNLSKNQDIFQLDERIEALEQLMQLLESRVTALETVRVHEDGRLDQESLSDEVLNGMSPFELMLVADTLGLNAEQPFLLQAIIKHLKQKRGNAL